MKVKELLDRPEKWTKGEFARDANGRACFPHSDIAACWCLIGAIQKCYATNRCGDIIHTLQVRFDGITGNWNDAPERTFAEVKALVTELDI